MRYLLLFLCFFLTPARAEEAKGAAAQLIRESILKKDPNEEAASLGRLPKGTILTLRGEQQNGFLEVEVELEEGSIQGWIPTKDLNRRARGEDAEEEGDDSIRVEDGEERVKRIRPRSKITVPKDEGLLLRRDDSFFYGIQAGLLYGMLQSVTTDYPGIGFTGGAHLGFFLDRSFPIRLEVNFTQAAGISDGGIAINVNFADADLSIAYVIERFEFFGMAGFYYGIGNSDLPADIKIETAADFSSGYGGGGIGYVFPVGEVTDMAIRVKYMISFNQDPLANQLIFAQLYFNFRG